VPPTWGTIREFLRYQGDRFSETASCDFLEMVSWKRNGFQESFPDDGFLVIASGLKTTLNGLLI